MIDFEFQYVVVYSHGSATRDSFMCISLTVLSFKVSGSIYIYKKPGNLASHKNNKHTY